MNAVEKIALFDNLFYVFMGLAIVGLIFAVFFFFFFDIPKIFSLITGRNKKHALEQMQDRSMSGKSLRSKAATSTRLKRPVDMDGNTDGLTRGNTAAFAPKVENLSAVKKEAETPPDEQQTTVLDSAQETTVLSDEEQQTTVLRADKPLTTVLKPRTQTFGPAGMTVKLTPRPERKDVSGLHFKVIEEILMIHTEDNI